MRKLVKAAAALTAGCMLLSTSAFAAVSDNINETAQLTGGAFKVDLTYDTRSGQSTILVVKEGIALADANDQNILYINQDAINTETGAVSYNVNLGATFTGNADVWVGGTNEGTATKIGTLKGIVPITGVTISGTGVVDGAATLVEGDKLALTATVIPDDTTEDKTVTWSTDKADIATVNETTGEVVAVKAGTATITASTKNGKTATVVITVNAKVVVPEEPTRDFISAENTDKGTIKVDVASVTDASMGAAVGNRIVSLALNATAYPETGYIVKVVNTDEAADVVAGSVVYYSTERAKYVALIPTTVTEYKFEVVAAGTAGETANAVIKKYGNMNEDATGLINILDVGQFQKVFKKTADSAAKTDAKKALIADVTGDGRVNILDVGQFQKAFKKQSYTFNVLTK